MYGIYGAAELDKSTVPGILDDTSVMLCDFGIEKCSSKRFQSRQRAFRRSHQAARARDIRGQNSRQSPIYMSLLEMHPRGSGKFNVHIA